MTNDNPALDVDKAIKMANDAAVIEDFLMAKGSFAVGRFVGDTVHISIENLANAIRINTRPQPSGDAVEILNGLCSEDLGHGEKICLTADEIKQLRAALTQPNINGDTSDGYHTFNELYEHRHALFLTICKAYKDRAWKSKLHSDGTMFDGWFIAGIATTEGQATYHLPLRLWDDFTVDELPMSPPWDGHTADDVIKRIKTLTQPKADVEGIKIEVYKKLYPEFKYRQEYNPLVSLNDCIDHLAAQGYIGVPQWQPIETAPKNGELFLGCTDKRVQQIIKRNKHLNIWVDTNGVESFRTMTYWMPLPAAPKKEVE